MPLGAPIGSGIGIQNKINIALIKEQSSVPVIVDAGVGTASDATIAMELGCDGVLLNTAIAEAKNQVLMADITFRGHVIECRINAEDPNKNFQPSPGTISVCHQPSGFRTRVDGAIFQGCKITPHYDSLICKLICQGRNRTESIQRMLRALDEFVIEGIATTIHLHKKILSHKKFINSDFDVNWLVKENFY